MFSEEGYEKTYQWAVNIINKYPNCNMLIWQVAVMLDSRRLIGMCENPDQYYVYKMARTKMDDYTSVIEYSTGNEKGKYYGVDNGNTLLLAFRAYLDETNVGASYYEVIYDRAIVFHKK